MDAMPAFANEFRVARVWSAGCVVLARALLCGTGADVATLRLVCQGVQSATALDGWAVMDVPLGERITVVGLPRPDAKLTMVRLPASHPWAGLLRVWVVGFALRLSPGAAAGAGEAS